MDPNEALARIRAWAMGEDCGVSEADAMELFAGLDDWLTGGGFLPDSWAASRAFSERQRGKPCETCGTHHRNCP